MSTKKRKKEAWQKSQTLEERRNVRSKISTIRKYVSQNAKEVTDDSDKATQMIGTLNAVFKSDGTRSFFFFKCLYSQYIFQKQSAMLVRLLWMHLRLLNCLRVV